MTNLRHALSTATIAFALGCGGHSEPRGWENQPLPIIEAAVIDERPHGVTKSISVSPVGWHDPLGATMAVRYRWYVNAVEAPGETNAFLAPPKFKKGDLIMAELTPVAGNRVGEPVQSAMIRVADEPTVLGKASLAPKSYYRTSVLRAEVEAVDPDDDPIELEYEWYVNDRVVEGESEQTLTGEHFRRSDTISVSARASGQASEASERSNAVSILNSPPSRPGVSIFPLFVTAGTEVVWAEVITRSTDADEDAITYTYIWYADGVPQNFPADHTTLTRSNYNLGQHWTIVAVADDGFDQKRSFPSPEREVFASTADPEDPHAPALESVTPQAGFYGTAVTITGSGFGEAGAVAIGGVAAPVASWHENEIVVTAPDAVMGIQDLTVSSEGKNSGALPFAMRARLLSVAPQPLTAQAEVQLIGGNFGAVQAAGEVVLNGQPIAALSWSSTQIGASIPPEIDTGTYALWVRKGVVGSNSITLETSPWIESLDRSVARAGDWVRVTGAHLTGPDATLYLGGVTVAHNAISGAELEFAVPSSAIGGSSEVRLSVGGWLSNAVEILIAPTIHAFYPAEGTAYTPLRIEGTAFGAAAGDVTLGTANTTVWTWSETAIQSFVPPNVGAGSHSLFVGAGGGTAQAPQPFVVLPYVEAVTVSAADVSSVTVAGTNFGASGRLYLDGLELGTAAWGMRSIAFSIPGWAAPGLLPLRVESAGKWSNTVYVEHRALRIERRYPYEGTVGTAVTLIGRYFGSVSGAVSVGGVAATVLSWAPEQVDIRVRPGTPSGNHDIVLSDAGGRQSNSVSFAVRGSGFWITEDVVPAGQLYLVWTGSEMLTWQGRSNLGSRYNPATDSWMLMSYAGAPNVSVDFVHWTGSEMIVRGENRTGVADGGRYDPAQDEWRPMSQQGSPRTRYGHVTVWTGDEAIMWGGRYSADGSTLSDGGRYNPVSDTWAATPSVAGRFNARAAWSGEEMYVWGGRLASGYPTATGFRYNPRSGAVSSLPGAGAPRASEGVALLWTGDELLAWGGNDNTVGVIRYNTGALYRPEINSWRSTTLSGAPPAWLAWGTMMPGGKALLIIRDGSSTVRWEFAPWEYDVTRDEWQKKSASGITDDGSRVWTGDEVLVWGDGNRGLRYDPTGDAWAPISPPDGRFVSHGYASSTWTGSEMLIWGSRLYSVLYTDETTTSGMRYRPSTDTWLYMSATSAPAGRDKQSAVWDGTHWIVWGGEIPGVYSSGSVMINTGGRYDPALDSWQPITTANAPSPRIEASVVWSGTEMIAWGGYDDVGYLSSGGRYEPVSDVWAPTAVTNAPEGRNNYAYAWSGQDFVVWGGWGESGRVATGGRYHPGNDTWQTVSSIGAPVARDGMAFAWSGDELVVYGGWDGSGSNLQDGAAYQPSGDVWRTISTADAPTFGYGMCGVRAGNAIYFLNSSYGGRYDPAADTWHAVPRGAELGLYWGDCWPTVWTGNEIVVYASGVFMRYEP